MNSQAWTQLLAFLSTAADYLGRLIIGGVHQVLPSVTSIDTLEPAVGYLALLTLFTVLVAIARKIAFIVLIVGWTLIIVRILMMTFKIA